MNLEVQRDSRPDAFSVAAQEMEAADWRPELQVEAIPAPTRIAPKAAAIAADVIVGDQELGTGRLILLHDPHGNVAWEGNFRCVSFAKATVDRDIGDDPLLQEVGWSWLTDALERHACRHHATAGTVTTVSSSSFGAMSDVTPTVELEIRASWTPELQEGGFAGHLDAWGELLCMVAGLPPLPAGVSHLHERVRRPRRRD